MARLFQNPIAPSSLTKPAEEAPLFRPEVLAEKETQWLGNVLLEPRVSSRVFSVSALVSVAAIAGLLIFGSFARKARINGWLVPEEGLARVYAPYTGVVSRIHAREGMKVAKGAPLVSLTAELQSETLGATREEIVRRLVSRRDSTLSTKSVQESLFDQRTKDLRERLATLQSEQTFLDQQIKLQRQRVRIGTQSLARERQMQARDLISLTRLQKSQQEQLQQESQLQGLERNQATLQRETAQARSALQEQPLVRKTALAEIDRSASALEQELAEAEAKRQVVITAPQDGTVTAIQTETGGNALTTVPLLSIVPAGSKLQAQLFSPSRAIGFVRTGQQVLLRYQPFPYQKFGSFKGTVTSVSRSAVSPSELSQQLSGLTSLAGATEPVYRITVDLERQSAIAYGEEIPLQPGMQLEADVMIESRRLYEWILDPLYTLTGKLGG